MNKNKIISFLILTLLFFSTICVFIQPVKADLDPDDLIVWAVTDTHGNTNWDNDVFVSSGVWSGSMIDATIDRIDFAFISGDILDDGGTASQYSTYINSTCSCIVDGSMSTNFWDLPANERIWGFSMGNHDGDQGGSAYDFDMAAEGLGLDSSANWYNNSVTMGHSYNYTIQKGNLLFIFMGGNRDYPDDEDYVYNLSTASDFNWFDEQVSWADENELNVLVVTHTSLWNGSSCRNNGATDYAISTIFFNTTSMNWETYSPSDSYVGFQDPWYVDPSVPPYWNASDSFWNLINTTGNINLWFNGHMHTNPTSSEPPFHQHMGWNDVRGTERSVQKGNNCTFINSAAAYPWDAPTTSYSRVLKFTNGSTSFLVRAFNHTGNVYGSDAGWQSSYQDITITNGLKYPYDPNWAVETNAPVFQSINNQGNNSVVGTGMRYFNWSKVDGATKYQLQIANWSGGSPDWSNVFFDADNITEGCGFESMPGGSYTEVGNYVEFYLPYAYNISWYGSHYYRVRAYTT